MSPFTYNDIVRISDQAPDSFRRGAKAWVIAVIIDRKRIPVAWLPPGTIYTVEYEDGTVVEAHESYLEICVEP